MRKRCALEIRLAVRSIDGRQETEDIEAKLLAGYKEQMTEQTKLHHRRPHSAMMAP